MKIVGYKGAGHDGSVCSISGGRLEYSVEAEKDSNPRRARCTLSQFADIVMQHECEPSAIAGDSATFGANQLNYRGISPHDIRTGIVSIGGRTVPYFSVPHEMCHIACSYALSDIPEGQEFYALIWEGYIGAFYHVDEEFRITKLGNAHDVMAHVGVRYSFPYHGTGRCREVCGHDAAGKIMALAALARNLSPTSGRIGDLAAMLLESRVECEGYDKVTLNGDPNLLFESLAFLRDAEVDAPAFVRLCRDLQDGIFDRFYAFACKHVQKRLPLVIGGGCGLNCDWNTRWRECGLFAPVFVPPVPNDSGVAIGAAATLQRLQCGTSKIEWGVYSGDEFVWDEDDGDLERHGFIRQDFDLGQLCVWMCERKWTIAWVQGRYEIGPRALGHRSLLAAPFKESTRDMLNRIKHREWFRPVAPICREEDAAEYFEWSGPSPHMLYFQRVKSRQLAAVTHVDGTARIQTVRAEVDALTHSLLSEFKSRTGVGVLCNTSLNFPSRGFINRTSHLVTFAKRTGLPAMVIGNSVYRQKDA
jgi:predicted NodU family carbamoyl transferase